MNPGIIISSFLFLIITLNQSKAQSLSQSEIAELANKLLEKKILNEKGKTELINNIEFDIDRAVTMSDPPKVEVSKTKKDSVTKADVLQFCAKAFANEFEFRTIRKNWKIEKKIKPEDSLEDGWTVSGYPLGTFADNLIHSSRSTFGATRTRTLNDFLELGLIDSLVHNDAKQQLSDLKIRTEVELLAYLFERQLYYNQYDELKAEQASYIKKLFDHGLLSDAAYNELINSFKEYELKLVQEILVACNNALRFDLTKFSADPSVIYPAIFQSIKTILPDFNYTELSIQKFEQPQSDLIEEKILITFVADSVKYSHKFFHDFRRKIPDANISREPNKISPDFHRVINKHLTDIDSEYRLHFINYPGESTIYGQKQFGLILLKEKERKSIIGEMDPYILTGENYDGLSSKKIQQIIKEFQQQGFFKHLSSREFEEGIEKVNTSDINTLEQLLACFPKTLVIFDWETGNLDNPYEDLLKQFEAASRGAFQVSNVVDEYKNSFEKARPVKFGFTLINKRYEKLMEFDSDWLDTEFLKLIKLALTENKIEGNIFHCVEDGQVGGFIFLSPSQLKFVQANYPKLLKD